MACFNVKVERIAYQIWWMTEQTGGDCTLDDLAKFTGASRATCRNIAGKKGWGNRYRRTARADASAAGSNLIREADDRLGSLAGGAQW